MMDTVLNLGLNDTTVQGLIKKSRQRAVRLGLLPSFRPDVRRRGDGPQAQSKEEEDPFEIVLEEKKSQARRQVDTELSSQGPEGAGERIQSPDQASARARTSPKIPSSSSGAPSTPCSAPGWAPARSPTASSTASPRTGAPRSTCRPWCSATWAMTAPPAWRSPATRPPATTVLRRVPDQRPGRGCRRRHPYPAAGQ